MILTFSQLIVLTFISITTIAFFNRLKSDLLRLQVRAAEIENGYRGEPLAITRQDEVGQLTDGINYMAQALAQREQALEIERRKISFKERMTAMDSLAGGIAHEVGNPITCIAGLVDEIRNDEDNHLGQGWIMGYRTTPCMGVGEGAGGSPLCQHLRRIADPIALAGADLP